MAQDIKTAFFDIDGTLTSFVTHVVPQSTVDALHALQRNGVKVFICSGRAPSYMGVVLDTIPSRSTASWDLTASIAPRATVSTTGIRSTRPT